MTAPRKIGLFGGTFDPVHLGHLHLATLAKDAIALDEVRFLPCQISPHKTGTAPASGKDRCEMLRLATEKLPWAVIDDFELHQTGPSYSYQTAESMAKKFPTASLFWIMGGDQWNALPHWKNPERLAARVGFIVLARGETPLARIGYRMHPVQGQHPASATAIRQAISTNRPVHPEWLSPAVEAWIVKNGLYRTR
jgi:nicotinate-nucleotide adenylyltransferase